MDSAAKNFIHQNNYLSWSTKVFTEKNFFFMIKTLKKNTTVLFDVDVTGVNTTT